MEQFVLGLFTVLIIWGFYMLNRNNRVYRERIRLLHLIDDCVKDDISNNREWNWRHEVLDSISHETMLFHFWRRVDSFYPDKRFITKGSTDE